ncbi:MAG: protein asteroid-like protein 1-like protein [Terrestrivirus sp.]|uniref:Protein asteroid-like protein 1-like protein n=1 Tax=Terrestrivirus sp. TaxID=2487775 RepID=A0A3G4ZQ28_9VIRU|nr:MAG: protein asteroid-like protein 1-like protein [Terrestrivirus sp.]
MTKYVNTNYTIYNIYSMGILKLNRDIVQDSSLFTNYPTNKIVIDGKNIMYYVWTQTKMNRFRPFFDIVSYQTKLSEYFDFLTNKLNFKINTVIMDGGTEVNKLSTLFERQQDRMNDLKKITDFLNAKASTDIIDISILHPFIEYYFFETVKSLGINISISTREADNDVAICARDTGAMVLSNDSDYYFMNIPMGYIPHFMLEKNDLRCYRINLLLEKYKLNYDDLSTISNILGNDYHEPLISVMENTRLNKAIALLKNPAGYELKPKTHHGVVCKPIDDDIIYKHIVNKYDSHLIDIISGIGFIGTVVLENPQKPSIWLASKHIRQCLYHLIDPNETFKENMRNVYNNNVFEWVNISTNNIAELVDPFNLNIYGEHNLDPNDLLFVISALSLTSKSNEDKSILVTNSLVEALVAAYLDTNYIISGNKTKKYSLDSVHIVSQWRGILLCLLMLSQYQFNGPTKLHLTEDQKETVKLLRFENYCKKMDSSNKLKKLLETININGIDAKMISMLGFHQYYLEPETINKSDEFKNLVRIITTNANNTIIKSVKAKIIKQTVQMKSSNKKSTNKSSTNMFALLADSD